MKKVILVAIALVFSFNFLNAHTTNTDPKKKKELKEEKSKPEMVITKGKVFYWQVETNDGIARGISRTEALADKAVKLASEGSIVNYTIVEMIQRN